jgi:hypothetical protein
MENAVQDRQPDTSLRPQNRALQRAEENSFLWNRKEKDSSKDIGYKKFSTQHRLIHTDNEPAK